MGYNINGRFISGSLGKVSGRALLRVDINVPVKDGKISSRNLRLREVAKNLRQYADNNIIPVIIAHQGRKGDDDYMESLEPHAHALSGLARDVNIIYSNTLSEDATAKVAMELKPGEALLLKNVRDHPDEKSEAKGESLKDCELVKGLSKAAEFYINDAPATMHRGDTSLIGFTYAMPHYLGLQMEDELRVLDEMKYAIESDKRVAIIFGGKKWEKFEYIYNIAKNPNVTVLCGGVPGQTISYLMNKDSFDEGNAQFINSSGGIDTASKLVSEFHERVVFPTDFKLIGNNNSDIPSLKQLGEPIMDIGDATLEAFYNVIDNSDVVIYAGPVGRYEKGFMQTLKLVSRAMSMDVQNYTLGGNSTDSMDETLIDNAYEMLGGVRITSGGSALAYLAGSELPVLRAFEH